MIDIFFEGNGDFTAEISQIMRDQFGVNQMQNWRDEAKKMITIYKGLTIFSDYDDSNEDVSSN
jgi:hypothetical protein